MDVKECQQCMNIFYNSNIYRDRIYHKLFYNNEFNSRETNCIINNLKKMFEKTTDDTFIKKEEYNKLFPILDNNKIKYLFKRNIPYNKNIKNINFKQLYNDNLNRLYSKNYKIKDYYPSNNNYFYIKFAVNERYEKERKNLDKTLYEYYYNVSLYSLNNKKILEKEINDFSEKIINNYSSVKIYEKNNLDIVENGIKLFDDYISYKKKNNYKIKNDIKNKENELLNIINNLLEFKTIILNKIGIIKPFGYLNIDGKNIIYDRNSFFFNKRLSNFYFKEMIYDNVGLIFYKNYYNGLTLDYIQNNLKKTYISDELKEYTSDLFEKALFQLIYTLYKITNYYDNFRHNDLHFKNVIVNSGTKNSFYIIDNNVYYIKDVNIKLIDFEMTTLGENNLINHYINNYTFLNEYGLSNTTNNSYDIHYILNIIYTHNINNNKYRDFVLRHIPQKEFLGRNSSYVNEWRLTKDAKLEINYINILNDKMFKKFRVLKFKK